MSTYSSHHHSHNPQDHHHHHSSQPPPQQDHQPTTHLSPHSGAIVPHRSRSSPNTSNDTALMPRYSRRWSVSSSGSNEDYWVYPNDGQRPSFHNARSFSYPGSRSRHGYGYGYDYENYGSQSHRSRRPYREHRPTWGDTIESIYNFLRGRRR